MNKGLRKRINDLAFCEDGVMLLSLKGIETITAEYSLSRLEAELTAINEGVLPLRYYGNMGTVGLEGQARLLQSRIAIAGLGGLGGHIAEGLARMGVGHMALIDGDIFEDRNLNRQIISCEHNLGIPKVEVARDRIFQINKAVEVVTHQTMVRPENVGPLLKGVDVVVDGLDSIPDRLILQKGAQDACIPLVHGSIAGHVGQVMTIFPEDKGLLALYDKKNPQPKQGIEATVGCPTTIPMIVASWQIFEVQKILLKWEGSLRNKILYIDLESFYLEIVKLGPSLH